MAALIRMLHPFPARVSNGIGISPTFALSSHSVKSDDFRVAAAHDYPKCRSRRVCRAGTTGPAGRSGLAVIRTVRSGAMGAARAADPTGWPSAQAVLREAPTRSGPWKCRGGADSLRSDSASSGRARSGGGGGGGTAPFLAALGSWRQRRPPASPSRGRDGGDSGGGVMKIAARCQGPPGRSARRCARPTRPGK